MNNNQINENERSNNKNYNYKRLDFYILTNNEIDINNEYALNEIYSLIINKKIIVIDCHLSKETFNSKEIYFNLDSKIIKNWKLCELAGFDSTPIELLYSLNNQNKELWVNLFELFCDYLRFNIINFGEDRKNSINMIKDFYQVLKHIKEITKEVSKYYKKRKKDISSIIKKYYIMIYN